MAEKKDNKDSKDSKDSMELTLADLAKAMTNPDAETARTGKRLFWQRVRHENEAPVIDLLKLASHSEPPVVRREAIWALSELGGDESVDAAVAMLPNAELREDARMVLQRLPGEKSLDALKAALKKAPDDFKPNIAASLRARGVEVPGIPDDKLKPCRQTKVEPVGRNPAPVQ
ncbi:MAG: HEAT repeat domain-containing protein [Phycisphaerae bacterium]|nr:HEAT repeat domain-containing protein [Phycisphaerae bacterium]